MTRLFAAASATAAMLLAWGSVSTAQTSMQTAAVGTEVKTMTSSRSVEGSGGTGEIEGRTVVTVTEGEDGVSSDTRIDTPQFSRFFDEDGNPTYLPDVTFSLD